MKYIDWVVPFDQYLALHPTPEIQLDKAIHIIICGILVHSHDMSTYMNMSKLQTRHIMLKFKYPNRSLPTVIKYVRACMGRNAVLECTNARTPSSPPTPKDVSIGRCFCKTTHHVAVKSTTTNFSLDCSMRSAHSPSELIICTILTVCFVEYCSACC